MVVNTTPNAMNLAVFTGTGFQQYSEGLPSASLDHTCLYRTGLGQNWSTTASIQSPVMTDEPWMFEDVSVTSIISDFPLPLVFGSSNDDAAKSPTMIRLCAQAIVDSEGEGPCSRGDDGIAHLELAFRADTFVCGRQNPTLARAPVPSEVQMPSNPSTTWIFTLVFLTTSSGISIFSSSFVFSACV